jgi:hypothetical protein
MSTSDSVLLPGYISAMTETSPRATRQPLPTCRTQTFGMPHELDVETSRANPENGQREIKSPRNEQWERTAPEASRSSPTLNPQGRAASIRASDGYFIELLRLLSEVTEGDILKGVVLVSIIHANKEMIRRMDANGHAFVVTGATTPDEMLQPVSVYALAKSLGVPYETTRRYVAKLIEDGLCIKAPYKSGLIVPGSVLASPKMAAIANRHYAQITKFVGLVNQFTERAA